MNFNPTTIALSCAQTRLFASTLNQKCCGCSCQHGDKTTAFCNSCFQLLCRCVGCGTRKQWVSAKGSRIENCLECALKVELLPESVSQLWGHDVNNIMNYYVYDIRPIAPTTAVTAAVSSSSPPMSPPLSPPSATKGLMKVCGYPGCTNTPEKSTNFHCDACHHRLLQANPKNTRTCHRVGCSAQTCANFPNAATGGIQFSCATHKP